MAEETYELSNDFMEVPVPKYKPVNPTMPVPQKKPSFVPSLPFEKLSTREQIIRTVLGEASTEEELGMQAVLNVIENRYKNKKHTSYEQTIKDGFSVLNKKDSSEYINMMSIPKKHKKYKQTERLVDILLDPNQKLEDVTNGADHYFNPSLHKLENERRITQGKPTKAVPKWHKEQTKTAWIGKHVFSSSKALQPNQEKFLDSFSRTRKPPPPAPVVEQPDWDFIKKIIPELTGLELEQRSQFDGHELWNKATETIEKYPNDPRKARMYFLKDIITNPDNAIYTNIITGESIELPKIGKKEGGLIQKYQKGDLVGPSTEPKTGFFNVSGGYSEKKRKPVGKINKNTPVVRGSEQKGISMQLQLPRAITDKIIKGLRLGGEYSEEKFIEKLSASNLFNEKMKTEIKKSGITVGKDKFDISLNKTSFKPEGQKSKNQYDAYGRFTVDKSPLGEITVNLNVEDFTGKRPQYGVSLRKEIKFKEGGFVSA